MAVNAKKFIKKHIGKRKFVLTVTKGQCKVVGKNTSKGVPVKYELTEFPPVPADAKSLQHAISRLSDEGVFPMSLFVCQHKVHLTSGTPEFLLLVSNSRELSKELTGRLPEMYFASKDSKIFMY